MNPCPCGFAGDPTKSCRCSALEIQRYRSRISGPILDRIDLHVDVPAVKVEDLQGEHGAESSSQVRSRVMEARQRQRARFCNEGIFANAAMGPKEVQRHCAVDPHGERLLHEAIKTLHLSARAYHRILKVARTVADLEGTERIAPHHVLEAIQYRSLDRTFWM